MMTPRSPSTSSFPAIFSAARRSTLKLPTRLIWITLLNLSSGKGPSLPRVLAALAIPAKFRHTWMAPKRSTVAAMPLATEASSVTSTCANSALSPSSATSASPASAFMSKIATRAPSLWKYSTLPRPMPDAPPVMTKTRSLICTQKPPRMMVTPERSTVRRPRKGHGNPEW